MEAAERASTWLWIRRSDPLASAAETQARVWPTLAGTPEQGFMMLKDPKHPMSLGRIFESKSGFIKWSVGYRGLWEFNGVREQDVGAWISLSSCMRVCFSFSLWYIRFCCSAFTRQPSLQNPAMMSSFPFIFLSLTLSSGGRRGTFHSWWRVRGSH